MRGVVYSAAASFDCCLGLMLSLVPKLHPCCLELARAEAAFIIIHVCAVLRLTLAHLASALFLFSSLILALVLVLVLILAFSLSFSLPFPLSFSLQFAFPFSLPFTLTNPLSFSVLQLLYLHLHLHLLLLFFLRNRHIIYFSIATIVDLLFNQLVA